MRKRGQSGQTASRTEFFLSDAGGRGGRLGRWEYEDFEAFFFFADAGLVLKIVEEAKARVELHGAVQMGSPGTVTLQVLAGALVPHDEAHEMKRTTRKLRVYGGSATEPPSGRRRCLVGKK